MFGSELNRRAFLGGAALATGYIATANAATRMEGGGKAQKHALKELENNVEAHRAAWGLPGMTVAVVTRDGFEGFVTSGLADVDKNVKVGPDHLFQIGSISKMFGALAAYSLIEEGRLSPETKLETALKGVEVRGGGDIVLQELLNHTAGLPADSSIFPQGGLWTGFKPGTNWSYSNCGYALAGMMAADAGGVAYPALLEQRVLHKIGMTATKPSIRVADRHLYAKGYEPALTDRLNPYPSAMTATPWVDVADAAGCIASTGGDMAKFLRFLIGVSDGAGGPVFSDETAVRFLADPAPADGWAPGVKYGNGIARITIDGRDYLHHTGGMVSFCSSLHVDREAGIAAFASTNVHYGLGYRPKLVTIYACELMRAIASGAAAPTPKPPRSALGKPARFAGRYTAQNGDVVEIIADEKNIRMRHKDAETQMQQAAPGLFASLDPEFAVTAIAFDLDGETASRLWAGEVEYVRDPSAGYRPPAPEDLRKYSGRYDDDNRWAGPLYIYARDGALWIGNHEKLTPLGENLWRLGDEASPERISFGGFINGVPHEMYFSGTPYVRRFS